LNALVVSVGKNSAWVVADGESAPRLAALRRTSGKRSMPVPGDVARVRILEDGTAVVDELQARRFSLDRRTVGGRSKTMAANVDAMVTVTSLARPEPRLIVLDQLLAFASIQNIEALVVFTKPDLAPAELRAQLEETYRAIGRRVITVNPKSGERIDELESALHARHALLCGVSGVGKSSIFEALGGISTVGATSRHGLGRQTTTAARLHRTGGDGFLIDSPGVNEFGLGEVAAPELAAAFPEIAALAGRCRFSDCSHVHEPGCAVAAAAGAGSIAATRYASYRKMLLEPT
jgi:ribosome biogenesis GTPase